ncbi:hypothetical protein BCR44DRAFT_1424291 [Catenaria anguillulae PL171]|uniref:Phosphatidate phosphatase APP1 catalytic domain-containing protein n=1 Tax=Catenaria anguillulae PL171 TaxID=765915 RepID=A0A1Y2I2H6_9FUNG|nr:hypothetical protein BCR44DRAFT_1424291 [Catenaria anguillulae PL171]
MRFLTFLAITSVALVASESITLATSHPTPVAPSEPPPHSPLGPRDSSTLQPDDDNQDDQGDGGTRVEAIVLPGFANMSIAADGSTVNVSAVGQAFLYSPPEDEDDVLDPYEGLFNVFRAFDLSPEQEQRLSNRSYYFKGASKVQRPPTHAPNAERPPESRLVVTLGDDNNDNGAVLVNQTFSNLPKDFVPGEPVADGLGSVLVPYQVAALQDGQQPAVDPRGGGGSYLVMQPRPQPGGGQVMHLVILSDIDDVLKDTRVYSSTPSREALVNTYAEIYQPIPGMPELFRDTIFALLEFFQAYYPPGSLTLRPVTSFDSDSISNFLSDAFTNEFRLQAHRDVLNTFPQALAVTYLDVLIEYPDRVQCVYLRRLQGSGSSLTMDEVVRKVNDRVRQELRERAREVVVVFEDSEELQGLDYGTSPVKCR